MRAIRGISQTRRLSTEALEPAIVVLFIQLIAQAAPVLRLFGPRGMAVLYGGFSLLVYSGTIFGGEHGLRRTVGWLGGSWRQWAGSAVAGVVLGIVVISATLAFGHPIYVVEPAQNEVLAITLGPIVEEVCLRGMLLPLCARVVGSVGAVILTSALFAILHWPTSVLKLVSIGSTGVAYGSIKARSGSTTFAATAHTTYNVTVLLFGLWSYSARSAVALWMAANTSRAFR